MAKPVTEQQYNWIKHLIQKHPTLSLKELGKLSGYSPRTICVANTTDNFAQYKEKVRKYNHKGKTNETPTDETHDSVEVCQTQIEDFPEILENLSPCSSMDEMLDRLNKAAEIMTQAVKTIAENVGRAFDHAAAEIKAFQESMREEGRK